MQLPGYPAMSEGGDSSLLQPRQQWFFSTFAKKIQEKEGMAKFRTGAQQGYSPDEITRIENAQEMLGLAEKMQHLSEEEFEKVSTELAQTAARGPNIVTRPTLREPNLQQGLLAAAGAAMFPQYGAEIAATPFNAQLDAQDREYADAQLAEKYRMMQQEAEVTSASIRADIAKSKMLRDDNRVNVLRDKLKTLEDQSFELKKAGLELADRKQQRFDSLIGNMRSANMPGEARTLWQIASSIDPVGAKAYEGIMESLEANLKADYDLKNQQREATLAKTKQATEQAEKLFPFKEQMAQLGIDGKQIANDLAAFKRDVLNPLTKTHMELRNKWFEPKAAAEINYKNFLAEMARANLGLRLEEFAYRQDRDATLLKVQAERDARAAQQDFIGDLDDKIKGKVKRVQELKDNYPAIATSKREDLDDEEKVAYDEYRRIIEIVDGPNGLAAQLKQARADLESLGSPDTQIEMRGGNVQIPGGPNLKLTMPDVGKEYDPGAAADGSRLYGGLGSPDGAVRPPAKKKIGPKAKASVPWYKRMAQSQKQTGQTRSGAPFTYTPSK